MPISSNAPQLMQQLCWIEMKDGLLINVLWWTNSSIIQLNKSKEICQFSVLVETNITVKSCMPTNPLKFVGSPYWLRWGVDLGKIRPHTLILIIESNLDPDNQASDSSVLSLVACRWLRHCSESPTEVWYRMRPWEALIYLNIL